MLRILDAIARPLTRLATMALMVALVWFFVRFGDAMSIGLYRWSMGEGVDLNGLAAVLAAGASMLGVVIPFIVSLFRDRRMERVEQIRAGAPPRAPFGRSGPEPAPETWPRPGDSQ
jgi:hypothetical protein